jgi:hypothetical protein
VIGIVFYIVLRIIIFSVVMAAVTMELIYKELKDLKNEVETVKYALIPEEKVSAKELAQIRKIKKEMEAGKEKSFKQIFC